MARKKKSKSKIHPGYKTRKYPTLADTRGRKKGSRKTKSKKQKQMYNRTKAITYFVFGILLLISMYIGFSPILESILMVKKAVIILLFAMGLYYYMISS